MTHRQRLIGVGLAVLAIAALAWAAWWQRPVPDVEAQARAYVQLALELGTRAPAEVDFYFGPKELQRPAATGQTTTQHLEDRVRQLRNEVEAAQVRQPVARRRRLLAKIIHLQRVVQLVEQHSEQKFEEQARLLFGLNITLKLSPETQALLQLDRLLPGPGTLFARIQEWRKRMIIAPERRSAVFDSALQECQRRTQMHWALAPTQSLEVSWTRRTAAAWHRYLGNSHSLLQINPDAAAYFPAIVTLACHEAYPGHHAQYLLMDAAAAPAGLPVEDTVVLLRSRQSVVLEGAANLGVELAFDDNDRLDFEREVLLPLAGLPRDLAAKQRQISQLEAALTVNVLPVLRDYYDGLLSRESAVQLLEDTALLPDAGPLLDYTRDYGAYVLGYTAARDLLRAALTGSGSDGQATLWLQLRKVVEHPADVDLPSLTVEE